MNTPDTERHELGIEHSTGANSTHLLKTTPDTEWTDAVEDIVRRIETLETDYSDGSYVSTSDAKKIGNDIQNLLTSRDTYWKERVRKIVDIVKYDSCVYQGPYAGHRANGGDELRKILLQSIDKI